MIHSRIKLASIFLLLFIPGCIKEKDELTLPVKVSLKMCLKISLSPDSSLLNAEYLHFTDYKNGSLYAMEFRGRREAGGDYYFETSAYKTDDLVLSFLHLSQPMPISDYDMPQGIYTDMEWIPYLGTLPIEHWLVEGLTIEELIATGLVEDWGDGFYWAYHRSAISGTYKYLDGSVIPFLFAGDLPDEELIARTFNPDGTTSIALSVDKEYEATMLLTLEYDFRSLSRKLFEEVNISGNSEHPVIIISYSNNKDLYEDLASRINLSAKVIIK